MAAARASDAAIGGGIAFVAAVFIFPSRERTRLPELLARMLDSVADYAVAVFDGVANRHTNAAEVRIIGARRDAGIALSEAENSLERLLTEPRHDTPAGEYALQLITYGRRAAGALTAIDTYSARGLAREAPLGAKLSQSLETFLVGTLHQAAAFARGLEPGLRCSRCPSYPLTWTRVSTPHWRGCYAARACSAIYRAVGSTAWRPNPASAT